MAEEQQKDKDQEEKKQEGEDKNKNQGFVPKHKGWGYNDRKPKRFVDKKINRQPFRGSRGR